MVTCNNMLSAHLHFLGMVVNALACRQTAIRASFDHVCQPVQGDAGARGTRNFLVGYAV